MTLNEFIAKCNELMLPPELALENDAIVGAIEAENDALVIALLLTEF
jgi:hypothetical protein